MSGSSEIPIVEEDHDLRTILALYDSNDFLARLEDAVKVLKEMIPSGIVEQEELLDDALAVVCGDLSQIMELGIKDSSLFTLLETLREMKPSSGKISPSPSLAENGSQSPDISHPYPHPAIDPANREILFATVIDLFKSPNTRQKFLSLLEDDCMLSALYLSFAPLRHQADCLRISRALRSLPQVSSNESQSPAAQQWMDHVDKDQPLLKNTHNEATEKMPEIVIVSPQRVDSQTQQSTAPGIRVKPTLHTRSRSNLDGIPLNRTPTGATRRLSFSRTNMPTSLAERDTHISPSYFSPPQPGQRLIEYLQSQDTETCADLERENAHFFVSDVIIAAVEQMQYDRRHGPAKSLESNAITASDEDAMPDSPEVDNQISSSCRPISYRDMVSDGQSSNNGTLSGSLEEEDETMSISLTPPVDPVPSSSTAPDCSPSVLDSRQDSTTITKDQPSWSCRKSDHPSNSAESIAVSLLRKFSEHYLPKADEMDWLVNESDVPQRLLPLPRSTFISPDSAQSSGSQSRIRGNLEWAPLRPQIIFHIQPHITVKAGIVSQKNRCAGCGGKMDTYQQGRMRFCEYTGKYFCVCCHDYKTSLIPARVLLKWDFTKHYVSNFAADFIAKIYRDPLFDVSSCNMQLYKKSKSLMQTRIIRTQLVLATEYVRTCRQGQSTMGEVEQLPKFVWEEIHTYSLDLFCSVKDGVFPTFLKPVADLAVQHVIGCKFCCAKGFICEFCRDQTPLFPFQTNNVFQCDKCFACFHSNCIKKKPCPKCVRLQVRRSTSPASMTS